MLTYTEPDFRLASEIWLHPGISEKEVLPDNYRFASSKDRHKDPNGGVAIIAKSDIEGVEFDLDTKTEFVAAAFSIMSDKKPLIVGSLYRPPDLNYTEDPCRTMSGLIAMYPGSVLWIGGDANLLDIDWKSSSITSHNYPVQINTAFNKIVYEMG